MKALGYTVLFVGLASAIILGCNIYSARARNLCAKRCPKEPAALNVYFDIGWLKLRHCACPGTEGPR